MNPQMDITNSFSERITTKTFGGVKTFCSWNSIEQEHFKKMFALRDNEFVARIEVDDRGITATIEKR
jgi:hypothetical protein